MRTNKVSFDFDGTLSMEHVQKFAKELIGLGHDVWIVTSRTNDEDALSKGWHWVPGQNEKLYTVAKTVGINTDNIVFTDRVDKIAFLLGKGFVFHLDDDADELMAIRKSGDPCRPVNVNHPEWLLDCARLVTPDK